MQADGKGICTPPHCRSLWLYMRSLAQPCLPDEDFHLGLMCAAGLNVWGKNKPVRLASRCTGCVRQSLLLECKLLNNSRWSALAARLWFQGSTQTSQLTGLGVVASSRRIAVLPLFKFASERHQSEVIITGLLVNSAPAL